MPILLPILLYGGAAVGAGAAVYSASQANKAAKTAKGQREQAERDAGEAKAKLASDKLAATELAASQIEDRKRALARNKTVETGPLGVEAGGQKKKAVLGQ